jgi:hypothetical protein
MNLKSFKIISLQEPKLFRRRESSSKFMIRGNPQGSSLSALLFLILYINDIFELPLRGHLQLYDDDAILILNYDELQRHMREYLLKIHDWFYKNLLSFNVSKTKYIIFNPKNKNIPQSQPNQFLVRGAEIERGKYTKYLGLRIDDKMNWSARISYIKTKIRPFLVMLRRNTYLIPSSTRLSVYYSFIQCHLTYLAPL